MHQRLLRGPEPRADHDAVRAQHQRRRQAAAVGDAARRAQQRLRRALGDQVGDLGHERERRPRAAVAAALRALGDDHVGAAVDGALGIGARLQLAEHGDAGGLDAAGERLGIVEGQEDRLGLAGDHRVQHAADAAAAPR